MPDIANRVGGAANAQQEAGIERVGLPRAMQIVSEYLAARLLRMFNLEPNAQPIAVANRGANAAAPATGAADLAAGAAGAAADPAPVAATFDTKTWITEQCEQITNALKAQNPGDPQSLHALYDAAKSLKESVVGNAADIRNSLSADFRNDFDANVAIIQACFNDPAGSRNISPNEIRFLHAYVSFLKQCMSSSNDELQTSLDDVFKALNDTLNEVTQAIQEKDAEVTQKNTDFRDRRREVRTAERTTTAAQNALNAVPVGADARAEIDALEQAQQAEDVADTAAATAQRELETATAAVEALRTPQQRRVETLQAEVTQLVGEHRALITAHDTALAANPNDPQIPLLSQQARQKNIDLTRRRIALRSALQDNQQNLALPAITNDLIIQSQRHRIQSFRLADNADLQDHVLKQTEREFKDVASRCRAAKNTDPYWLKSVQHFEQQLDNLAANPNSAISLPDQFATQKRPGNPWASEVIADTLGMPPRANGLTQPDVYQYALRIVGDTTAATPYEKKLALMVLGGWSSAQSVRNGNPSATHFKASNQMESAAQLLAASLTLRTLQPAAGAAPGDFRNALIEYCRNSESPELYHTLNNTQPNTPNDELQTLFKQGVSLAVAEKRIDNVASVSSLLQLAKTDRTYQNDVTTLNGASRQGVFKESMIKAVEILKGPPAANAPADAVAGRRTVKSAGKARAIIGTDANLNRTRNIPTLLGLNNGAEEGVSTELLDQLVLASVAQNDLSTNSDHVSRGSLLNHIQKFELNSSLEFFKNHKLHKFEDLSNLLTHTAIQIRPLVNEDVDAMKRLLRTENTISKSKIDLLVKQIIITTDAKAAGDPNFNLRELVESAEKLGKSDTPDNRLAFSAKLTRVQEAWTQAKGGEDQPLLSSQWDVKDQRTALGKALKSNPIKSLPFVNQIPLLGRITAAVFDLAKGLLAVTAGTAGGAIAVGVGVPLAIATAVTAAAVAAPIYGVNQAVRRVF